MSSKTVLRRRPVLSWAFYDWANSAFATTVMAGFFPVFFKQYWNADVVATESTFRLGVTSGLASLIVALLAPVLGAIADRSSSRVRLLMMCTVLGAAATAGLALVAQGHWLGAAVLYMVASLGFWGGIVCSDSLLLHVAEPDEYDVVSGFGYAMGYLGGGLLFAVNVFMTLQPALFGLADAGEAVRVSFVMTGIWWLVFALPCVFFVKEKASAKQAVSAREAVRLGFRELRSTLGEIRRYKSLMLFLIAYCPVHRRREHDHQDGDRLRDVAGPGPGRPDQGAAADPVRGLPRGARLRLDRAPDRRAQRHLHRAGRLRRGHVLRVFRR